jgi:ectoine hydroxylase-related dioxygenase (phytanoyl-CoA dioxygenase family)
MLSATQVGDDTRSLQQHFSELDERGYTVLKDLLTAAQVAQAIVALQDIYEREKDVPAHELGTKRSFNLTARAEIFREIIQLPKLVACMEYLLGPDYILSDMGGRSPMPGVPAQHLHRDGGRFLPDPPANAHDILPIAAQSMFAFSEFTTANGATRFVPGSHNKDIDPSTVRSEDEFLFTCAPGTALVYDNRLIHGGGRNDTNDIRYSAQGFCCRKFVRPFCDHTRSIPRELVESASPLMRRLWGFEYQSAWEASPRQFTIVEAPGAKPVFDFNRRPSVSST